MSDIDIFFMWFFIMILLGEITRSIRILEELKIKELKWKKKRLEKK